MFDDDDGWQQHKDDIAQGIIEPDGTPRDAPEPNCFTCCDSGVVRADSDATDTAPRLVEGQRCPDCTPSPEQRAVRDAEYAELVAAGKANFDDEPPF